MYHSRENRNRKALEEKIKPFTCITIPNRVGDDDQDNFERQINFQNKPFVKPI